MLQKLFNPEWQITSTFFSYRLFFFTNHGNFQMRTWVWRKFAAENRVNFQRGDWTGVNWSSQSKKTKFSYFARSRLRLRPQEIWERDYNIEPTVETFFNDWLLEGWYTNLKQTPLKVSITTKSFFRLNKSFHLFEMHCAFLPLFNPNIDLLQAVKVTKSGHHLSHDRASKGYGSIPCLTSQTSLHACLQRLNTMQISLWHQTRNRPGSVVWQMMARFRNFYNVKKVTT